MLNKELLINALQPLQDDYPNIRAINRHLQEKKKTQIDEVIAFCIIFGALNQTPQCMDDKRSSELKKLTRELATSNKLSKFAKILADDVINRINSQENKNESKEFKR